MSDEPSSPSSATLDTAVRPRPAAVAADLRVAVLGPVDAAAHALIAGVGAVLIDDLADADAVHVTSSGEAAVEALTAVPGHVRCVVLHDPLAGVAPEQLERLAADAEHRGVVVAAPLVMRYYPMLRVARRRVSSGRPGPLNLLHGWAATDAATAWCDLAEFVSGHRLEQVSSAAVGPVRGGASATVFRTDRGAVGALSVSGSRPIDGGSLLLALDGVEESLLFHEGRPDLLDVAGAGSTQRFQRGVGKERSRYSRDAAGHPQGHRDCWASYVGDAHAAATGRRPDGLPTIAHLARAARLARAVRRSRSSGWTSVEGPASATGSPNRSTEPTEGTPA